MALKKKPVANHDTSSASESFQWLDLNNLRFDPTNPRIAELLPKRASQEDIRLLLMGGTFNARELIPSFSENGFLPYEPMIVRPPDTKAKYEVLEGNRRLAALLSMRDSKDQETQDSFREHQLNSVPCIIFQGTQTQELAYLGLRHLSKTKDWSASAKAAFVERVLRSGKSLGEAATMTNTGSGTLRSLLLTRRLFERANGLGFAIPAEESESEISFWHLGDAIRRSRTKQFLNIVENSNPLEQPEIDETHLESLVGWLYGNPKTRTPRIIQSIRDIPDLDQCLGNPRATRALQSGSSLSDAVEELQQAGANFLGHVDRASRSLKRALTAISEMDEASRIPAMGALDSVSKLLDQARTLLKQGEDGGGVSR